MKKLLFILFSFLVVEKAQSQIVFCPPGAEWNYLFFKAENNGPSGFYNEQIKYIRDSLLGSETVKVLYHKKYYYSCNDLSSGIYSLIKQRGDTIFMRNAATQHAWQILYNFAALAGQSWTTTISLTTNFSISETYTVTVDSVKNTTINNFVLKDLYVKYVSSNGPVIGGITHITERMGCARFMFNYKKPGSGNCNIEGLNTFLCYRDNAFGLKQLTAYPCDYSNPVGLKEHSDEKGFGVFPNPAKDIVHVKLNAHADKKINLKITDATGRLVEEIPLVANEELELNTSVYSGGVYFLNLVDEQQVVETKRLVIIH